MWSPFLNFKVFVDFHTNVNYYVSMVNALGIILRHNITLHAGSDIGHQVLIMKSIFGSFVFVKSFFSYSFQALSLFNLEPSIFSLPLFSIFGIFSSYKANEFGFSLFHYSYPNFVQSKLVSRSPTLAYDAVLLLL